MKNGMKISVAAILTAALSTPSIAAGNYTFNSGTAPLTFNKEALQALNVAGIEVGATAPSFWQSPTVTFTVNPQSVKYNAAGDSFSSAGLLGGLTMSSITVPGAKIDVSNLIADANTGRVTANIKSYSRADGYKGQNYENLFVFTSKVVGDRALSSNVSVSFTDILLTSEAIPVIGDALGVPMFLASAIFPTLKLGSVNTNLNFQLAPLPPTPGPIPEPGTFALLALGLLGLAAARGRNMKH